MRLTQIEIRAIIQAMSGWLEDTGAALYLYGSRVDDRARGGDIDLLLFVDSPDVAQRVKVEKARILVTIKSAIGDQRVDLRIGEPGDREADPFVAAVMPHAVRLHTWQG